MCQLFFPAFRESRNQEGKKSRNQEGKGSPFDSIRLFSFSFEINYVLYIVFCPIQLIGW
jgi:hypothetical protein